MANRSRLSLRQLAAAFTIIAALLIAFAAGRQSPLKHLDAQRQSEATKLAALVEAEAETAISERGDYGHALELVARHLAEVPAESDRLRSAILARLVNEYNAAAAEDHIERCETLVRHALRADPESSLTQSLLQHYRQLRDRRRPAEPSNPFRFLTHNTASYCALSRVEAAE